jgi:hypothetical protein
MTETDILHTGCPCSYISLKFGKYQEAIKTQERAITKPKQEGGTKDLAEFEQHLSSYKAGKPWREK